MSMKLEFGVPYSVKKITNIDKYLRSGGLFIANDDIFYLNANLDLYRLNIRVPQFGEIL